MVIPDEDVADFEAVEAALTDELAPEGALQSILAGASRAPPGGSPGPSRLRSKCSRRGARGRRTRPHADPRSSCSTRGSAPSRFETLLRHRGAATPELTRALRTLKALQAEQAAPPARAAAADVRAEVTARRQCHPGRAGS